MTMRLTGFGLLWLLLAGCAANERESSSNTGAGNFVIPSTDSASGSRSTSPPAGAMPAPALNPVGNQNAGPLNPAHGQPGHRCDIAVGAPLNSAPAQTTPATTTPAAPTVTPATPTVTPATGKGLNPAHGQPGHRCEIPVGAPLDSKETINVSKTETPQPSISAAPAINLDTLTVNPPHGKPGHRCDIADGAPLKPKTGN